MDPQYPLSLHSLLWLLHCSLLPSWRSEPKTSSSERSTSQTSHQSDVIQSKIQTHSVVFFCLFFQSLSFIQYCCPITKMFQYFFSLHPRIYFQIRQKDVFCLLIPVIPTTILCSQSCFIMSSLIIMNLFLGFPILHRGSMVLGYTEAELCVRGTGYQFIHAADMLYCAENHVRSKSQQTYTSIILQDEVSQQLL